MSLGFGARIGKENSTSTIMPLDLIRFSKACEPSRTIRVENPEDRKYYIDFAKVRGGKIIEKLKRNIARLSPDEPTCQLFTGHIGCGKSTELGRLKFELEQQGFYVVYFDSSQDLVMADVDVTDILLAIARQVSASLEEEKEKVSLQPTGFQGLLQRVVEVLQTEIEVKGAASWGNLGVSASTSGEFSLSLGIAKITAKTKNSFALRDKLRQFLEPRTANILEDINKELLSPAISQLQKQGKKGLVVIVDSLDRVDNTRKPTGKTQPEYLFVDRGEQLKGLDCHVVYTIPMVLMFSNEQGRMQNRFGVEPKLLPMVRVRSRDDREYSEGMTLLRQMVLARAFPQVEEEQRLSLITEVFDEMETLDRLCQVSGGHVRNLLLLLNSCFEEEDPPFSRQCLEDVIRRQRNSLIRAITEEEWTLLRQIKQQPVVKGKEEYQTLLRSMFVFEYEDDEGPWYRINPILAEAKQLAN